MSQPIDFYFDFISPYAYIASTQIEAVAARHGRSVRFRPVLLGITVMKIMGLKPLMETPLKSDYLRHDGPRMAKVYGVPFRYHGLKGINSLAACRAFLWIGKTDPALAVRFAHAVFKALWVDGRDITPADTVAEIAASFGIDAATLKTEIASEQGKLALNAAVEAAIGLGVFGVPYVIADGEPLWGTDRLWMLDHWLTHRSWDGAGAAVLAKGGR
jgi:2-hydroxychromene-2-carboxylate isomerase